MKKEEDYLSSFLSLQVDSVRNITLSQEKAQRAMLIKDCFGDWGVVVGEWSGFRKGVAGTPGVKGVQRGVPGIPGKPGCLMLAFYQLRDKHGVFCANVSTSLFLGFRGGRVTDLLQHVTPTQRSLFLTKMRLPFAICVFSLVCLSVFFKRLSKSVSSISWLSSQMTTVFFLNEEHCGIIFFRERLRALSCALSDRRNSVVSRTIFWQ